MLPVGLRFCRSEKVEPSALDELTSEYVVIIKIKIVLNNNLWHCSGLGLKFEIDKKKHICPCLDSKSVTYLTLIRRRSAVSDCSSYSSSTCSSHKSKKTESRTRSSVHLLMNSHCVSGK